VPTDDAAGVRDPSPDPGADPAPGRHGDRRHGDRRHGNRRDRVRALLAGRGLDRLVVTDLVNIRYLTGFTGSNAVLVLAADGADDVFLTDPRYVEQSAAQVPDLVRVVDRAVYPALARTLAGVRTVGVETHVLTVDQHETLRGLLADRAHGAGAGTAPAPLLVPGGRLVEGVRVVKDDDECDTLRRACAISVAALAALVAGERGPLAGRTEREVAGELDALLVAHGADGVSFDTIVATGPDSASPHHEPGERRLAPGDLVVVDFGALVGGYHADMTRTLFVRGAGATGGPAEPAPWQTEIHGLTERANAAGRAAAEAGAELAAVDGAARELITAAGHGEHFTHGLGHGVGLDLHEDPFVGPGSAGTLSSGTVVTVEPGIYLSGRGGVRIEDTVLVVGPAAGGPAVGGPVSRHGGGPPEVLTQLTRELLAVD